MKTKLTGPQRDLLTEIAGKPTANIYAGYKPAARLVELGLAEIRKGRYGGHSLSITEAGRRALGAAEVRDA